MKPISTIVVAPSLPEALRPLEELAYNLHWAWDAETIELFRRIDRNLWEDVYHNPVRLLGEMDQAQLEALSTDPGFLAHLRRADTSLQAYMSESTWLHRTHPDLEDLRIGYFSAEFGLSEAIPIYSGGLGVLAGDHLKSASDLGLPLVGVGLLYQEGYHRQYLNSDGWQQEDYVENDFYTMPVRPVTLENGEEATVRLPFPEGEATVKIWKAQVGRVPLFLLDTNLEQNHPNIRSITAQLYGGDQETRIRQEILLGIGGLRALHAIGLPPSVCHMNEGHSAFVTVERIRQLMHELNLNFETAREAVAAGCTFTTHTPVPAGHDVFGPPLVEKYFRSFAGEIGLSLEAFQDLGRRNPGNTTEGFNMTVLAVRHSAFRNGVSKLHGQVSRQMWQSLWPGLPEEEIPIQHITNGIHVSTWISHNMRALQDNYLGPQRLEEPQDQTVWENVNDIPPEELWRVHERRRERLVAFSRTRLRRQLQRRSASPVEIARADEVLDSKALTIGFARRFATYKRATLLLRDPERLSRILCNPDRPVQIIFAGKAHPHDTPAKEYIRQIIHLGQQEHLRNRIVFIEDYDMCVARYLVQGVDIWLNNPQRPLEASGTSGMKAMANGALNLSVLDGWWAEAYQVDVGWAIGQGEEYEDPVYQDQVEADALYQILEKDAIPLFYQRGADGLPRGWVSRMKSTMRTLCPLFNTHRMVHEYAECFYLPAQERFLRLMENGATPAGELARWRSWVQGAWKEVRILDVQDDHTRALRVGEDLEVRARVVLGPLSTKDVVVQIYHGQVDTGGEIVKGETVPMDPVSPDGDGIYLFSGRLSCNTSGRRGYTVRALPTHKDLGAPSESRLIAWA
ncbi:MAG: alpha-glucan family phosphorylase [bacterium]|nr:alpha-glucan family phosphorylase [bacterium]